MSSHKTGRWCTRLPFLGMADLKVAVKNTVMNSENFLRILSIADLKGFLIDPCANNQWDWVVFPIKLENEPSTYIWKNSQKPSTYICSSKKPMISVEKQPKSSGFHKISVPKTRPLATGSWRRWGCGTFGCGTVEMFTILMVSDWFLDGYLYDFFIWLVWLVVCCWYGSSMNVKYVWCFQTWCLYGNES